MQLTYIYYAINIIFRLYIKIKMDIKLSVIIEYYIFQIIFKTTEKFPKKVVFNYMKKYVFKIKVTKNVQIDNF